MFKEKVNAQMDGRMDACMMDNGLWHKLAGLWLVELKSNHWAEINWHYTFKHLLKSQIQVLTLLDSDEFIFLTIHVNNRS